MKTPREILFERHRKTGPKLDAIRQGVIAGLPYNEAEHEIRAQQVTAPLPYAHESLSVLGHGGPTGSGGHLVLMFRAGLRTAWRELFWPCRRAWVAIAAIWLAVVAVNLEMKPAVRSLPAAQSVTRREMARTFEEQRRVLAELLQSANTPRPAPTPAAPQPRSERSLNLRAG